MPLRFPLGKRQFNARWLMVLLAAGGCALFTCLGFWQWHRGQYREEVWAQFQHETSPAAEVTGARLATFPRFTRVRVQGRLDTEHQVLLENRPRDGRPGYEVLTPLVLTDGSLLLVNRGWLPFSGYRDRLPDVTVVAPDSLILTGRLDQLPTAGLASGRAPPATAGAWPRLTTFPTTADLTQILGQRVDDRVLLLDADSGPGYERRWLPPGVAPDRNFSYAIQWWAFAAIALGLFLFLNVEKRR